MSNQPTPHSRRQFFGKLAQGAVAFGGAPAALFSANNPFAYDVSRFGQTDLALVGWQEESRRTTPLPDARRIAIGPSMRQVPDRRESLPSTGGNASGSTPATDSVQNAAVERPDAKPLGHDVVHVSAGSTIVRWNDAGALPPLAAGATITALAVAADQTVFAALRRRLVAFDAGGKLRPLWESENEGSWFSGIAIAEQELWIADSGLRVIWHCDRNGKSLGRIAQKQTERNVPGLVVPSPFLDVRLHPDGLLRVNNPGRHRVEAYTTGGDLEFTWGTPTAAVRGFCGCCNPIALAVLPDGRVVTAEKGLPRVKVYASDGTFQSVVAGTETFPENVRRTSGASEGTRGGLDVAVDSRGRIHILDRVTGEVRVMRPKAAT